MIWVEMVVQVPQTLDEEGPDSNSNSSSSKEDCYDFLRRDDGHPINES